MKEKRATEIKASNSEIACLQSKLGQFACGKCDDVIRKRILQETRYRDSFR
jgi:hypothetical protein